MPAARTLSPLYVEPQLPAWWNRLVLVATVASLMVLVADMGLPVRSATSWTLGWIDFGFCTLFLIDFGIRLRQAPQKWAFVRHNWPDLVGSIPLVGPLRAARLVRFIRLLRIMRIAALTRRLVRRYDIAFPSQTLGYLTAVAVVFWFAAAGLFYYFEHGVTEGIQGIDDALWWSMTTLSTVGYGDLYPQSDGGRIVAMLTMIFGIGVLGTLAGTISNAFLEVRERARRGERSYTLSGHLLVLGWNDKSRTSIEDFRHDPRYADTTICIVAGLEHTPIEDKTVKFVRGVPGQREVLERASAEGASAALVFARDPLDGRSDHETALTILALRRLNPHVRISAELVDPGNREHLEDAGCNSVIDLSSLTSTLIARSVQDVGISELVSDLLTNKRGSEIYRVPVDDRFVGGTYGQYVSAMVERNRSVLGILRRGETTLHPAADLVLQAGDEAFVVAAEPP